jgi:hypothetical protein
MFVVHGLIKYRLHFSAKLRAELPGIQTYQGGIEPDENLSHVPNLCLPKFQKLRKMNGRVMIPRPKTQ